MWLWQGKEVTEEDLEGHFGFIYIISRVSNYSGFPPKSYIGKKQLNFSKKKKLTLKELAAWNKPGKKPTHKRVTSESDWKKYWGSEKELQKDVKEFGEVAFTRTIIRFCSSKKQLSYYEENTQHKYDVLSHPELFYNRNISGRYFVKDLV